MLRWALIPAVTVAMAGPAVAQSAAVARGDYLANTIMTCANCHSPKGPPAATAGKDYSGGLRFNEPPFDATASNITPPSPASASGQHERRSPVSRDRRRGWSYFSAFAALLLA